MATLIILFGIIGHLLGLADPTPRNVRPVLHPTSDRRNDQPGRSARVAAKLSRRSEGKG
jgi:hypothetical protein